MIGSLKMSPPGRAVSRLKRQMVDWQRARVARAILRLPPRPVPGVAPERASIHTLTSRRDWLSALWSVRTFMEFLGESLPVRFHDDGTLTPEISAKLRAFFPGSLVISATESHAVAEERLHQFPKCRAARGRHIMTHKLIDAAIFAPGARYLLLDSDLLFFSPPREISQWLPGPERVNLWNEDQGNSLNLSPGEARARHGVNLVQKINAGFGAVWRDSVDFNLLEEYFQHETVWSHPHRVEQTAYALLSSRFGVRLLPRSYLIDTDRKTGLPAGIVMKHYVGIIRDLFFSEGIRHLTATGFLAVER